MSVLPPVATQGFAGDVGLSVGAAFARRSPVAEDETDRHPVRTPPIATHSRQSLDDDDDGWEPAEVAQRPAAPRASPIQLGGDAEDDDGWDPSSVFHEAAPAAPREQLVTLGQLRASARRSVRESGPPLASIASAVATLAVRRA